jgi:hypothetical protein
MVPEDQPDTIKHYICPLASGRRVPAKPQATNTPTVPFLSFRRSCAKKTLAGVLVLMGPPQVLVVMHMQFEPEPVIHQHTQHTIFPPPRL